MLNKNQITRVCRILFSALLLLLVSCTAVYASDSAMTIDLADGEYSFQVECIGGSGKASVSSPALMIVKDARAYAQLSGAVPITIT